MKAIITQIILLLAATYSATAGSIVEGQSCRKFEEGIYLRTALNDIGGVAHYLDSLRNCGNESPEVLLTLGRYLYNKKDYAGSDQTLLRLIQSTASTRQQSGEAYYYLGLNAYYRNMYNEAVQYLLKGVENGFKPYWCYNSIGLALADNHEYERALAYYNMSLEDEPGYTVALNNIGVAYDDMGKADLALSYYMKADASAGGTKALYRSNITREWRDLGKQDSAMQSARIGILNFPDDKRTIYDMGNSLSKFEKYSEAIFYGRKLLQLGPHTADDWFDVAHLYDCAGKPDSALYFYKMSIKLDSASGKANHNTSIIYKRWGMFDKAHEYLDRALRANPKGELFINSKIQIYVWQYDFENAYKWCQRYNSLYPGGNYSYLNTGYVLMQLKKYDEAITWLEKELVEEPNDDRALNNIGRCYAKSGRPETAMRYFERALALNPDNAYTYHNRASLYNDMGQYELACADLRKAIDKEYTWLIDSSLFAMKEKYCADLNLNRNILIREYRGNAKELKDYSFIELIDSLVDFVPAIADADLELNVPEERPQSSSAQNAFSIYPNPGTGVFTVERILRDEENLSLRIFDMQGKLLNTQEMQGRHTTINLTAFGSGSYIVMVVSNNAVLSTQKVMVVSGNSGTQSHPGK